MTPTAEALIRQAAEEVEWWQSRRWGDLGLRLRAEAMTALVGNLLAALTAERARADRAEQERDYYRTKAAGLEHSMIRVVEQSNTNTARANTAVADRDREAAARKEAEARARVATKAFTEAIGPAVEMFQPGGKYHHRANLTLGCCVTSHGTRWLDAQLQAAEADRATLDATSREIIDGMAEHVQELQAQNSRAQQAREEAESKLDTLRRQIGDNTALLWITAERDALRGKLAEQEDEIRGLARAVVELRERSRP